MVTYDGASIFGAAVQFQHLPQPSAQQVNTYFGVNGTQSLYGGGRGRTFVIRGILQGSTMADLNAAESALLAYADGVARTLVDSRGRKWSNVLFRGEYQPDPRAPYATPTGWAMPYRAVFYGLS